jgi:hypothetical protein
MLRKEHVIQLSIKTLTSKFGKWINPIVSTSSDIVHRSSECGKNIRKWEHPTGQPAQPAQPVSPASQQLDKSHRDFLNLRKKELLYSSMQQQEEGEGGKKEGRKPKENRVSGVLLASSYIPSWAPAVRTLEFGHWIESNQGWQMVERNYLGFILNLTCTLCSRVSLGEQGWNAWEGLA